MITPAPARRRRRARAASPPCGRSRGRGGRCGRSTVSPSATRPAMTSPAEARRSVAITVAPDSRSTPWTTATRPSTSILRAQAQQLVDVHEAVLEDRLGDRRRAVGDAVERHQLRLHVGRERRVLAGANARPRAAAPSARTRIQPSPASIVAPASRSLSITASRWSARAPAQHDVAAGGRDGAEEGAGLDPVGDDPVRDAVQRARRRRCGSGSCRGPRSARPSRSASRRGRPTSGSCAAFSRIVSPSASVAAISRFSVPVTVTMSVVMRAPCRPLGAWRRCSRARRRSRRPSPAAP